MMYCSACAKMLDEDLRFCPDCNEEDPFWVEADDSPPQVSQGAFRGEVFDKLREINQHIEENPHPPPRPDAERVYEERPGTGLYAALIMLAVCLPVVGLIMGFVYFSKTNKNFQPVGIIAIVVSIVFLLVGLMMAVSMFAVVNRF